MIDDQTLVSVILITEDASDDDVYNTFKNILTLIILISTHSEIIIK